MGFVASSKMRRAAENMNKSRQYAKAVSEIVEQLSSSPECRKSPFIKGGGSGKTKLIVIAGDRGLAGGYNANVFRLVKDYPDAEIVPIGKRACERYGSGFITSENFSLSDGAQLSNELCREFLEGEFSRLGIVYTKAISVMTQEASVLWVLPLSAKESAGGASAVFEPDELTILNTSVPEYLNGKLIGCVRESFCAEVAARRMAMDAAGKNARAMIDDLRLQYNRARQGAITQEITEIVAGAGED